MAKTKKIPDEYRYTYEVSHSPWGEVKRRYKEKSTRRMHVLLEILEESLSEQQNEFIKEIYIKRDSYDKDTLNEKTECILNKYLQKLKPIMAEMDAEYLIANHIARRNKLLHPDTAIKILKKMHKRIHSAQALLLQQKILDCEITDLSFPVNCEHNVAYFLYHKYNVLLMNPHTYNYIQEQLGQYNNEKWLKKYKNLSNKFHKSVIGKEY